MNMNAATFDTLAPWKIASMLN